MRLIVLGSGTSHGVPMIGCDCTTCRSSDPRDTRTNASVLISAGERSLLIDCGRDFRAQALRHGLGRPDAVLITHAHYDHVAGLDDLRVFTSRRQDSLPVYGPPQHLRYLREHSFRYLFEDNGHAGGGVARLDLRPAQTPFEAGGFEIRPVSVMHGSTEVYGYRIGGFAYLPDVSRVPQSAMEELRNLALLIIDGLRYRPHAAHLSVDQALAVARSLSPARTLLTHICHDVLHADLAARLERETGGSAGLAHDGLVLDIGE